MPPKQHSEATKEKIRQMLRNEDGEVKPEVKERARKAQQAWSEKAKQKREDDAYDREIENIRKEIEQERKKKEVQEMRDQLKSLHKSTGLSHREAAREAETSVKESDSVAELRDTVKELREEIRALHRNGPQETGEQKAKGGDTPQAPNRNTERDEPSKENAAPGEQGSSGVHGTEVPAHAGAREAEPEQPGLRRAQPDETGGNAAQQNTKGAGGQQGAHDLDSVDEETKKRIYAFAYPNASIPEEQQPQPKQAPKPKQQRATRPPPVQRVVI